MTREGTSDSKSITNQGRSRGRKESKTFIPHLEQNKRRKSLNFIFLVTPIQTVHTWYINVFSVFMIINYCSDFWCIKVKSDHMCQWLRQPFSLKINRIMFLKILFLLLLICLFLSLLPFAFKTLILNGMHLLDCSWLCSLPSSLIVFQSNPNQQQHYSLVFNPSSLSSSLKSLDNSFITFVLIQVDEQHESLPLSLFFSFFLYLLSFFLSLSLTVDLNWNTSHSNCVMSFGDFACLSHFFWENENRSSYFCSFWLPKIRQGCVNCCKSWFSPFSSRVVLSNKPKSLTSFHEKPQTSCQCLNLLFLSQTFNWIRSIFNSFFI